MERGRMERGKSRALLGVVMVMGMLVGQSSGTFQECYVQCFIFCVIEPPHSAFLCSVECLKDCIISNVPCLRDCTNIPKSTQSIHVDAHDFCKLGCASSLCTNISTRQNPDGEKVESCVDSCSERCTKNYVSSPSKN